MRLPSLLLSVLLVPVVVVAAPVTTPDGAPEPHPVEPSVVELPLDVPAELAEAEGRRTVVLTGRRDVQPFSTVGVTWAAGSASGEVAVSVRTRDGDGDWSAWTPLETEDASVASGREATSPGLRDGAGPAWTGPRDGVQVRVEVLSGSTPEDVELVLVDPGSSPADAPVSTPWSSAQAQEAAADGRPLVRSRADWGADESLRSSAPEYARTIEAVTVHHTAGSNDYAQADVPAVLRGIYAFHVKSRGWSDIGYHVLVDRFGTAWEGRAGGLDRPVLGAHAGGFNTGTTGISMMGTFEDVVPSAEVVSTVAGVAAWKLGLYARDPAGTVTLTSGGSTSKYPAGQRVTLPRIFGHRDTGSTSCPGAGGYSTLGEVRRQAVELAASSTTRTQPFGALEDVTGGEGRLTVTGWAVDADSSTAVHVVTTVDGEAGVPVPVSVDRPEVQRALPPYPVRSGFSVPVEATPGEHTACVAIVNQGAGEEERLGCRTVTVREVPPPPPPSPPPASPPPPAPPLEPTPRATDDSCPSGRVPSAAFRDTTTSVHRAAVECGVWWDVVRGRADGTFGPAVAVTRGQMAVVLARTVQASGGALPASPPRAFDDLGRVTAEVRLAVEQLAAVGVLKGRTARTFDPGGLVTRGQMATFLAGAYEFRAGRALPAGRDYFTDDDGSVHEAAIGKVAAAGFTGGTTRTTYSPGRSTERGQTASFATRVLDLLVEQGTTPRR